MLYVFLNSLNKMRVLDQMATNWLRNNSRDRSYRNMLEKLLLYKERVYKLSTYT